MRLANVSHGHTLRKKLRLAFLRVVSRRDPPDVIRTLLYRPEFFGDTFSRLVQTLLRGPASYWSVGERELFAAFTSHLEACRF
jgi:hypothetical protein